MKTTLESNKNPQINCFLANALSKIMWKPFGLNRKKETIVSRTKNLEHPPYLLNPKSIILKNSIIFLINFGKFRECLESFVHLRIESLTKIFHHPQFLRLWRKSNKHVINMNQLFFTIILGVLKNSVGLTTLHSKIFF